jgi:hypothetical protein
VLRLSVLRSERGRAGLAGTIGPVAVGVILAFAWNLAVSPPRHAAGVTVQQTAEQAWAFATPRGPTGHPAEGDADGRQDTRPGRSG